MSGGVDSSAAAYLVQKSGVEAMGVTLRLFDQEWLTPGAQGCCDERDIEDARAVAARLGIAYDVLDFSGNFRTNVIDQFVQTYQEGGTPNPCVTCNRTIKFPKVLSHAAECGCSHVATGHYARVERDGANGRFLLKKAVGRQKDQSYVLYSLTQEQLGHIVLPLGALTKEEVRTIAQEQGFFNAEKPDSQDICFVKDGDYGAFIERLSGRASVPGDFVDREGKVLGRHKGIIYYTVGQRKGLGLAMNHPVFVCGKDPVTNTVTIGEEADLFTRRLVAKEVNLIACDRFDAPVRLTAKTRYAQKEEAARVEQLDEDTILVEFEQPQRAITRGQSVVLYDGDTVVGGGIIQ